MFVGCFGIVLGQFVCCVWIEYGLGMLVLLGSLVWVLGEVLLLGRKVQMIKVVVFGVKGCMGIVVCQVVEEVEDIEFVVVVDSGGDCFDVLGVDVIVDFIILDVVMDNLLWVIFYDINIVVGMIGFDDEWYQVLCDQFVDYLNIGCLVVLNFFIGVVFMMYFVEQVVRFYEFVEIVELYYFNKVDVFFGIVCIIVIKIVVVC